ncbi:MAG: insulinase family protein [Bacteroidaceae bacterium]|nr:insulinase family protein [Bacteroidaceae bacterium]
MIEINKHTLNNGLRIVHSLDTSTQMIALNIAYGVGARNESPSHTGFAHLFEHLMFGGSANIPNYDVPAQMAGAENNAWTNNDITNFYITLPYQNRETAFWLESDRMLSLDFSQRSLDIQKNVVIEEFKQRCLNEPYGNCEHFVRKLAYKVHPYQWPTIGKEISHIEGATLELVKEFFYSYYAPNNAVLAVTGNISFEETIALAEKWFGNIPQRNINKNPLPVEPRQTEYRHAETTQNVPHDKIFMCFHMCDHLHPDFYTYDLMSDLLSNGQSSRLIQNLVRRRKLFTVADAYISGSIDPGLFTLTGKLYNEVTLEDSEEALWEEIEQLKSGNITEHEIDKVKNKFESTTIFSNMNYLNLAMNLALYEIISDAELINTVVDKYRVVTIDDIVRVANKTFTKENCSVLFYRKSE